MTASAPSEGIPAHPIGDVLSGLRLPPLPDGVKARNAFVLVEGEEADGSLGWFARVTAGVDNDELLGVLTGYQEHLKQEAAASWNNTDPTRADD